MTLEKLRAYCLGMPGATEQIQWGADLVFKVGGKMFCVACTEVAPHVMSFKCDDELFAQLCEREGIVPAPYMARAKWVALERWDTLSDREIQPLIAEAYRLVKEKLPRKTQAALSSPARSVATAAGARRAKQPPTRVAAKAAQKSAGTTATRAVETIARKTARKTAKKR